MKGSKVAGLGSDQEGSETGEGEDEWNGFDEAPEAPTLEPVDHEEEYIDEDLYTTVKVEAVSVDRDGLHNKMELEVAEEDSDEGSAADNTESKHAKDTTSSKGRKDAPKKKKKKFRYETKLVRQMTNKKNKARKSRG
jgi:ribosomal RNA-processing protein 17